MMKSKTTRFDLALLLGESEQGLSGLLEYNGYLFDEISMAQMMENYQALLEALVADPEQRIWDLPLLGVQPESVALDPPWWSLLDAPSGSELQQDSRVGQERPSLYERFALQVERMPLAQALVYGSEQLSYRELHERASHLAELLQEQGVTSGTPVGLALERSLDQVVGLLAILKIGGIFVPLEKEEPWEALIEEVGMRVVLTRKEMAAPLQQSGLVCLCIEKDAAVRLSCQVALPASNSTPAPFVRPANRAETRDACAFLPRLAGLSASESVGGYQYDEQVGAFLDYARQQDWGSRTTAGSVWSLLSSAHFVYELFLPLVSGKTAHLVPEERRLAGQDWSAWLAEQQVTSAYVPALLLPALLRRAREGQLSHLRLLLIQAETYPQQRLAELQEYLPEMLICNGYGSPEIGMWTTLYPLQQISASRCVPPIGRPYGNTRLLLLDRFLHAVPRGVHGEVYVEQTGAVRSIESGEKRFQANPLAPIDSQIYKTGAWARLLPDGNLELLGLEEQSLRVHGLQVWPAECAALLAAQPGVYQAVALVQVRAEGKRELVAYVVPEPGNEASSLQTTLELLLKEEVPISCAPSALLILEQLPLTRHGLLDVSALPSPSSQNARTEAPPVSSLERDLLAIWRKLLNLENIGVQDNFFDRGGHSLLLIRLHNEIQSSLKLNISILDLFRYPTIRTQATYIQHEQNKEKDGLEEQISSQEQHNTTEQIDSRVERQKKALLRQQALIKERRRSHGTE